MENIPRVDVVISNERKNSEKQQNIICNTWTEGQSVAEINTQKALDVTGFGKFNYKIIVVSGLTCMNVAFTLSSIGFVLPSASCDFQMITIDKGRLSTAPILGMLVGSYIWGCLADTMGRKSTLVKCLFIQGLVDSLASLVPYYWGIVILKSVSGIALGGQSAILYTYMGEFQPSKERKRALSCLEIPWVLGTILTPVIAWLIIPLKLALDLPGFFFHSWNAYLIICSVPAWLIGWWLVNLPETPKYLSESGQEAKLIEVLTNIYKQNTGKSSEEYRASLLDAGILSTSQLIHQAEKNQFERNPMMKFMKMFYEQTTTLLKPPFAGRTLIVCLVMYSIFSSLYTLMLWFPEMFERFLDFEETFPDRPAGFCLISSVNVTNSTFGETEDFIACSNVEIDYKVFMHALILGLSCIPVAVIFPMIVNRVGFKICLVFCTFVCSGATGGLLFVRTSTENLILSCIFEALVSVSSTVIACVVVEVFPTNLRTTAAALSSLFARGGALVGNMTFSYLIDNYCIILICILAGQLLVGGFLAMFLPSKSLSADVKKPSE